MPTVAASGTQSATLDTEHTLATVTTNGNFVLVVDLSNMVNGDVTILRLKRKVLSGDSALLAYAATFANAQGEPVKCSVPVPSPHSLTATLEQTDGTGRDYKWSLERL